MREYTVKIGETKYKIFAHNLSEAKDKCVTQFGKEHRKKVSVLNLMWR